MNLEEELKELEMELVEKLKMINPEEAGDEYESLLRRLQMVQDALGKEASRLVEASRLDVEKAKNKAEKRKAWWQVGLEILKGVIFVVANGVIIILGVRANNSGEVLPKSVEKIIRPKELR